MKHFIIGWGFTFAGAFAVMQIFAVLRDRGVTTHGIGYGSAFVIQIFIELVVLGFTWERLVR